MDYYDKCANMTEDQLTKEIETLSKRLFKMRSGPMYDQLADMVSTARSFYGESLVKRRFKDTPDAEILNIGEIHSVDTENYDEESLLNLMVQSYISEPKNEKH